MTPADGAAGDMTAPAGLTPLPPPPSLLSPASLSPPLSEPDQPRQADAGGRLSFFGRGLYQAAALGEMLRPLVVISYPPSSSSMHCIVEKRHFSRGSRNG